MTASVSNLPKHEQPISEQFRIVARQWVDADAAAAILEELKTTTLENMKSKIITENGDMADNKAERLAKCSPDWEKYIREMCEHRAKANKLKLQMEYLRMKFNEQQSMEANGRHEARLSR